MKKVRVPGWEGTGPFISTAMPSEEHTTERAELETAGAGVDVCTGQKSFSGLSHHSMGNT
ncbi:hypothetical protein EYF80_006075 [Liparis tanakae]|uniref:Uncharacterized protein n=1 Tax=Liparis tanakae TaxID=230148 RepID=A0A4Z2J0K7_9TELE|nr:hypothetical protein EYF80_006075 [Liparis tanakae]